MMVKYAVLSVLSIFIILGTTVYIRTGAYKDVTIDRVDHPGLNLVYKAHHGPYHEIIAAIREVEKWAALNDIKCEQTFGHFLDDPKSVEQDRLRSHAGCVVHAKVESLPKEFEQKEVSPGPFVWAKFEGSPSIGPLKVYPKIQSFAAEKQLKLSTTPFEIYTIKGEDMTTEYLFSIVQ